MEYDHKTLYNQNKFYIISMFYGFIRNLSMQKSQQTGRSMIEMLGVLAIIGVLSVGGLAGYSKAMFKYKMNRTVSQISQTVARIRLAFIGQNDYSGMGDESNVNSVMVKANIIPPEYIARDPKGNIIMPYIFKNPFKGNFRIRSMDKTVEGDKEAFAISYDFIPKPACIELATIPWDATNDTGYIGVIINIPTPLEFRENNCAQTPINRIGSAIHCAKNGVMLKEAAAHACTKNKNNYLEFVFY